MPEMQVDGVAAVVQRLAVLLEAGVAPSSAWGYLLPPAARAADGRQSDDQQASGRRGAGHRAPGHRAPGRRHTMVVRTIARAVGLGVPADSAIGAAARVTDSRTAEAWRAVAAVWRVAGASGAPIAPCLREVAGALREIGDTQRAVEVALAAPVATARLMTVLPLAALGFGALLGFNSLRMLTTTVPGLICLVAGLGLLVLSRAWNARLVRVASGRPVATGLAAELTAVAMGGGVSVDRARELAGEALEAHRLREPGGMAAVDVVVELSRRAGVPAAELLRSEARLLRTEALARSQKVCAALSIRLMIPLGLCVLPAFMLLGVAPLLLAVVSSTFGSW
ncbi:hypothetical protein B7R54_03335 [Subtercola boreus]|uniref:Type II secretion system protein GspF domain-containing protein n=1 Tax=Subtercola boreus TaxID=120213 RepID=A0A3E0VNT2_9MICO|nr:hypothetical protein [Subtercola boreus]RFA11063.1 hypothetical protein B7R54_03335 [Subtercola boreus]TQL54730.1 tight adherence protein B [Subtercola boreus]